MDIGKVIEVILKRSYIIVLCIFIVMFFECVWNYIILQPYYKATTKLLVYENPSSKDKIPVKDQKKLDALIRNEDVSRIALNKLGVKKITSKTSFMFLEKVDVRVDSVGVISISFPGYNPKECAKTANAFAEAFIEKFNRDNDDFSKRLAGVKNQKKQIAQLTDEINSDVENGQTDSATRIKLEKMIAMAGELQRRVDVYYDLISKDSKKQQIMILEKAKPPEIPIKPDRKKNIQRGFLVSLIAGIWFAFRIENKKNEKLMQQTPNIVGKT